MRLHCSLPGALLAYASQLPAKVADILHVGRPWLRPPFRRPGSSARTAVLLAAAHGCPRRRSQLLLPCFSRVVRPA
jgi:hypothetical protein